MDLGLKDKIVIVTGAGGGIGREVAKAFGVIGAKVVVTDINEQKAFETLSLMEGTDHYLRIKNLANVSDCEELIGETIEKYGQLNILVNVAAILKRIPIEEVDEDAWNMIIDTNLKSQFFLSRAAVKEMAKRKYGRIINFSSQGGFTGGFASSTVYNITKGAILTMTKSFARTYASEGICVNAIAPGGVNTEMMKLPNDQLNAFTNLIPIKRLAEPDELVGAVLFLASNWSSYITGATIDVTGGQLMH